MSSLASCWCPEEVGFQVTFEELQGWLSSYEGGWYVQDMVCIYGDICKGRSCIDGEERTNMPNCPDEVIA